MLLNGGAITLLAADQSYTPDAVRALCSAGLLLPGSTEHLGWEDKQVISTLLALLPIDLVYGSSDNGEVIATLELRRDTVTHECKHVVRENFSIRIMPRQGQLDYSRPMALEQDMGTTIVYTTTTVANVVVDLFDIKMGQLLVHFESFRQKLEETPPELLPHPDHVDQVGNPQDSHSV